MVVFLIAALFFPMAYDQSSSDIISNEEIGWKGLDQIIWNYFNRSLIHLWGLPADHQLRQ
jgi:hypothetical protein